MRQGIICPTSGLKRFAVLSNYHLVLAHIVESDEMYRRFYAFLGKEHFITLDNSSFEIGDGVYSPEDLVRIARTVNASEIMAPETYENGEETAHKILEFCNKVSSDINVFGTIHGTTLEEISKCFLDVYKFVKTIGFSCRLDFKDDVELNCRNKSVQLSLKRLYVVNTIFHLIKERNLDVSHLEFHLLGMNHPIELSWYDDRIRSCDSSCAYISGRNEILLKKYFHDYTKSSDTVVFSARELGIDDSNRVVRNINFLNELMGLVKDIRC